MVGGLATLYTVQVYIRFLMCVYGTSFWKIHKYVTDFPNQVREHAFGLRCPCTSNTCGRVRSD